jgi:alkyldihydroxyacetonephosphate synthase
MQTRFRPTTAVGRDLLSVLPEDRISQGAADRLVYSRDMWPRALLSVRDNKPSVHPPDYIVWPESTEEVAEIVRVAARHKVGVIPYGGGSGVCGGAMATGGGIVVDLKRMCAVEEVSPENHLATFMTGINGQILEDQLNLRGLTLGHFPASIYCSTLGGWLAARSAGQLSSRYGKIEDMVQELEVVLGDGRVVQCSAAHQPDLIPLIVGSEGTLGIITRATMRVHPLAGFRLFRGYEFPRVAAGCEAMRRVLQRGLRPAVMRLYDEMDTLMARPSGDPKPRAKPGLLASALQLFPQVGASLSSDLKSSLLRAALSRAGMVNKLVETLAPRLSGGCLAILGFEGEPMLTETEAALCHAEYLAAGGRDLGEGPGLAWYKHRYAVSYKMSPIYAGGGFVDTMEVAATWDRLMDLYREVRRALAPLAVVLAHFSHAYPEGCSIYFTFAGSAEGRVKSDTLYDEIWRTGLGAVVKAGGTISHHHGVGQSKAAFMQEEHGASMTVFRQLKAACDPEGILNPGKMGL